MPQREVPSSCPAQAETKMPRIGSHEVPTRTLLLMGVDIAAAVLALLAATGVRLPGTIRESLHDPRYLAKVGVVTVVCWLSLYFNDLYDFRVVRRRADLLPHTMQALGTPCLAWAAIYFISPVAG